MSRNDRFPQLDTDAPLVPLGMRPKSGVEYGCGDKACPDCYERIPPARVGSIANPAR